MSSARRSARTGRIGTDMLYLGTSGYSYDDWVGPFYPPGTPEAGLLALLRALLQLRRDQLHPLRAAHAAPRCRAWPTRTADDFQFAVKSFKDMTIGRSQDPALYREYRYGLEPLLRSGKLGCILLQFPNRFNLSQANVNHLAFIREQWPELPLVVEFRHASWIEDPRTFDFLREQRRWASAAWTSRRSRASCRRWSTDRRLRLRALPRAQRREVVQRASMPGSATTTSTRRRRLRGVGRRRVKELQEQGRGRLRLLQQPLRATR